MKRCLPALLCAALLLLFAPAARAAGGYDYGDQLKDEERAIYDALARELPEKKDSVTVAYPAPQTVTDENAIKTTSRDAGLKAYEAFYRDYPEVFWVTKDGGVTVTPDYERTGAAYSVKGLNIAVRLHEPEKIDAKKAELESAVSAILAAATGSDYDKLKAFHDAIVSKCSYDEAAKRSPAAFPDAYEAYGALVGGKAVCEGYAKSLKLLCDRAGISCVLVGGKANGGDHMWNYVLLGGSWYLVDATFDDPVGGEPNDSYFLKGSAATAADHTPQGGFMEGFESGFVDPTLAKEDYDPAKAPATSASVPPAKDYCTVVYTAGEGGRCAVTFTGIGEAVDLGQQVLAGINLSVEAVPYAGYEPAEIAVTMGGAAISEKEKNPLRLHVTDDCSIRVTFQKTR